MTRMGVSDARDHLSEVVDRARYTQERVVLTKRGREVGAIISIDDLNLLEMLEDQLVLQEKQFKYNLQNSLENYYTQQENVEVALSVYDSYMRKYEQGMATSLDLTQANGNYLDAESNYLTAMMEVMNARLQLDKLMNKL